MILGLSHIYGEARTIEDAVGYWLARGWRSALRLELPVPPEKKALLGRKDASRVRLEYLELKADPGSPGIEFVQHMPSGPLASTGPLLRLHLPSRRAVRREDPYGNVLVESPGLERTLVEWAVPHPGVAREPLLQLGFVPDEARQGSLMLRSRLMPQRAFSILLAEADGLRIPHVDDIGWNGISLLVRDLDAVAAIVPLTARQTFSTSPGEDREVGFFSANGLLIEFLAIRRQGAYRVTDSSA